MDRFALPTLPENPSAAQTGEFLYYYHCMPCHGDRGQGLTDEFRQLWVEDHQNCWGRGCHAGRPGDDGFPLPRSIPRLIGGESAPGSFHRASDLEAYLRLTHPPQNPGVLADDEYQALTAYLWEANGRQPLARQAPSGSAVAAAALVILWGTLVLAWGAAERAPSTGAARSR